MKILISADLEGIAGLVDPDGMGVQGFQYPMAQRLMTEEVNAAIEGAVSGGANEIVVVDAHGRGRNLLPELLNPAAELVQGSIRPLRMMQALDGSFDGVFFVGYHTMAGTAHGVLNHTLMGREIHNLWLNGEPAGEIRLNAGLAGWFGVPILLLTGDTATIAEGRALLGALETVAIKSGIDRYAARSLHPTVSRERIREAAARALEGRDRAQPYVIPPPITLTFELASTTMAAVADYIPGVRLDGPRTVSYATERYPELLEVYAAIAMLARQVSDPVYG
ncbi:MAG: M55 family metallopeptidase [Candidatus Rokubacteria bacterium]|nr:M55 family metallopeptidase [Candidatus Rokubacteria bacterium]